jgi:hypothetical protein
MEGNSEMIHIPVIRAAGYILVPPARTEFEAPYLINYSKFRCPLLLIPPHGLFLVSNVLSAKSLI